MQRHWGYGTAPGREVICGEGGRRVGEEGGRRVGEEGGSKWVGSPALKCAGVSKQYARVSKSMQEYPRVCQGVQE